MYALVLEDTAYAVFDMAATDPGAVSIELLQTGASSTLTLTARIVHTSTHMRDPLHLLEGLTSFSGRMQPLPQWVDNGAIVGLEGGTTVVSAKLESLKKRGVPISAVWIQDWSGVRTDEFGTRVEWNWELDADWYPNWNEFVLNLKTDAGIKVMTYINPYLANNMAYRNGTHRNLFVEAASLGLLVQNSSGLPYLLASGSPNFTFGTLDLTNPLAQEWFGAVIRCNMLGDKSGCTANTTDANVTGIAGWMADFGEYLPWDAVLHSGKPAAEIHNAFPELWAQVNRQALIASGMEGEVAFFSRSGYTKSPASSTLFWAGDQLVTWDADDGMQTVLIAHQSGGMSGMTLSHSDCGGYTMINMPESEPPLVYLRSKELLMRWMELSAFADVVLRTHPGNLPTQSWQIDSDDETLEHFTKFARVHNALALYRRELMQDASAYGHPVIRHLWLHYPADKEVRNLNQQFMLGKELLVAPVMKPNSTSVRLYLPPSAVGKLYLGPSCPWVHVWTGRAYSDGHKGLYVLVHAPVGQPAVFFRACSVKGFTIARRVNSSVHPHVTPTQFPM